MFEVASELHLYCYYEQGSFCSQNLIDLNLQSGHASYSIGTACCYLFWPRHHYTSLLQLIAHRANRVNGKALGPLSYLLSLGGNDTSRRKFLILEQLDSLSAGLCRCPFADSEFDTSSKDRVQSHYFVSGRAM